MPANLGLCDQRTHCSGGTAHLFQRLGAGSFGFGSQALDSDLSIGSSLSGCLLMDGKLLLLQFTHSGQNVLLAC